MRPRVARHEACAVIRKSGWHSAFEFSHAKVYAAMGLDPTTSSADRVERSRTALKA